MTTDDENSLSGEIKLCRQMIKALGPTPSPLLKEFIALCAKLTTSQEIYLFRRGSLLSREVVREIASNIAKITLDEMKLAGIDNDTRMRIQQSIIERTGAMIAGMANRDSVNKIRGPIR
jgi:hypothetical protein